MKEKLIIAHRGDTASAVENTIESFEGATHNGADMIELDVRRTKDGVFIIHHSPKINRQAIRKITWNEISAINRQRKFEIPKFEDVLKSVQGKIKLDIELKEVGWEKDIVGLILKYLSPENFIVTSFNDCSAREIKKYFPRIMVGLLLSLHKPRNIFSQKRKWLLSKKRYRSTPADFFLPHITLVKMGFLEKIEKFHKPLIIWTVDDRRDLKKLWKKENIAGIITNKLETALLVRDEMKKIHE
jgi:glycerophosphoryl diester phosphodiesterase